MIALAVLALVAGAGSAQAKSRYCSYKTDHFPLLNLKAKNTSCGVARNLMVSVDSTVFDGDARLYRYYESEESLVGAPFKGRFRCSYKNPGHRGIYHMVCQNRKAFVTADLVLIRHGTRVCGIVVDSAGYLRRVCRHYSRPWKVKVIVYNPPKDTGDDEPAATPAPAQSFKVDGIVFNLTGKIGESYVDPALDSQLGSAYNRRLIYSATTAMPTEQIQGVCNDWRASKYLKGVGMLRVYGIYAGYQAEQQWGCLAFRAPAACGEQDGCTIAAAAHADLGDHPLPTAVCQAGDNPEPGIDYFSMAGGCFHYAGLNMPGYQPADSIYSPAISVSCPAYYGVVTTTQVVSPDHRDNVRYTYKCAFTG